jgi:eukaryotic-like serine/threonine-protein kinase
MTRGQNYCPYCEQTVVADVLPTECPYEGDATCPLFLRANTLPGSSTLEETIAYPGTWASEESDDGFPETDDLVDSLLGQYRLGPVIGRGSMGRVYRGEHSGLQRTCAIKVMNPSLVLRHPQIIDRFWAEARALANLVHPHVVTIHNLGSDRGYHYIEMEYVPGGVSLKESVVLRGALKAVRATTLVSQVVEALGAAHDAGLVHRDVKPSNVLLTADDRAKLADFGLVRGTVSEELTGAPIAGTPTFMAPELFLGAPASPGSDIYAVGIMYYYLLSARLPFAADYVNRLIQLHHRAPVPDIRSIVPEAPDLIATILGRCLAKDASHRYTSADELTEDLQAVMFQLRDPELLMQESLEGLDAVVESGRDRWRVLLKVPGDRLQEVRIEVTEGRRKQRLLTVYSVCCPADSSHFEFALKLNAELTYGSLSVREVDGQPMFVMARAYPGGNVGPDEVRAAVHEIASQSDWVEQQLTQSDIF